MLAFNNTILLTHLAWGIDKDVYEDYTQATKYELVRDMYTTAQLKSIALCGAKSKTNVKHIG